MEATINANVSGKTLALNAANGGVTNTGTLEATGGGVLTLNNTITNASGNVTASGAGSTVNVVGNDHERHAQHQQRRPDAKRRRRLGP